MTRGPRPLPATSWIETGGMSALLALLAITIFVVPLIAAPISDRGRSLMELCYVLLLLGGAWAVSAHRRAAVALAILAIATLAVAWLPLPWPEASRALVHQVGSLLATMLLAVMVGIHVFSAGRITTDRIMGAVALYLLLGLVFGTAFEVAVQVDPKAFTGAVDPAQGVTRWFYFSFVTLTTVGYGDITPVARSVRTLAVAEAMVGQLYPAIILARLVTLETSTR